MAEQQRLASHLQRPPGHRLRWVRVPEPFHERLCVGQSVAVVLRPFDARRDGRGSADCVAERVEPAQPEGGEHRG